MGYITDEKELQRQLFEIGRRAEDVLGDVMYQEYGR